MGDLKAQFAPRHDVVIFATKGRFEFPGKRPDDVIACPKVGNNSQIAADRAAEQQKGATTHE